MRAEGLTCLFVVSVPLNCSGRYTGFCAHPGEREQARVERMVDYGEDLDDGLGFHNLGDRTGLCHAHQAKTTLGEKRLKFRPSTLATLKHGHH